MLNIVDPVAKDNASQIIFSPIINGNPQFTFNIPSNDANAMQNSMKREIDLLNEPKTEFKEKVLLYWYQARNDTKSQTGDKAIVESICFYPVKTVFVNELIKTKMLLATKKSIYICLYSRHYR